VFSYTKGVASSGSGFNVAILFVVEQLEVKIRSIIRNRSGKNFSILF
jgi:hypothetical protein